MTRPAWNDWSDERVRPARRDPATPGYSGPVPVVLAGYCGCYPRVMPVAQYVGGGYEELFRSEGTAEERRRA